MSNKTPKVTGVGGVFFKCKDVDKVKEWYGKHLGFPIDAYGAPFILIILTHQKNHL